MTLRFKTGDCREILPVEADVCITDPPYAVDKHGNMIGQIAHNYHEKGTHTRGYYDHSPEKFRELLQPAFDGIFRSLPKGATFFAFCGNRTFAQMVSIAESVGFEMLDIVVLRGGGAFAKSKSMLSPRAELAMYMRRPGGVRNINPEKKITNVWDIPKTRTVETALQEGDRAKMASLSTVKPHAWMERIVEVFSEPGDTILDPFAGSGSTLIAAHRLGRSAIGIEIDPTAGEVVKARVRALLAAEKENAT